MNRTMYRAVQNNTNNITRSNECINYLYKLICVRIDVLVKDHLFKTIVILIFENIR